MSCKVQVSIDYEQSDMFFISDVYWNQNVLWFCINCSWI